MSDSSDILQRVRRALGHPAAPGPGGGAGEGGERAEGGAPVPPPMIEPVVRLVHSDIGLPELFARRAAEANMSVELVRPEELAPRIVEFVKGRGLGRIGQSVSPLLDRLGVSAALKELGAIPWDQLTLDAAYDLDAGVTDVAYAVAETGSLVVRPSAKQGRSLSLIPPVYIAVVEPSNCVGDLLDLFERVQRDGIPPNLTLITGPSKTADIEGALVIGVHGPGTVQIYVLQ